MENSLKMVLKLVVLFAAIATILVGSAYGTHETNSPQGLGLAYPDWNFCIPELCPSDPKCCPCCTPPNVKLP
jgi:hypothetical protein